MHHSDFNSLDGWTFPPLEHRKPQPRGVNWVFILWAAVLLTLTGAAAALII